MPTAQPDAAVVATEGGSLPETPDACGAFPRLGELHLARLAKRGERRAVKPGDVLLAEGTECREFFVVLRGKVMVIDDSAGRERVQRVHGERRFLGELGLLSGQPAFVSVVAYTPGEVLVVPVPDLLDVVTEDPVLGDLILRAYLVRRSMLIRYGAGFQIIGSRYSRDVRRMKEFATRNRIPHRWIDLEVDPDAEALLRRFGVGVEDTPVVIWRGTRLLRNPSNLDLAAMLGLRRFEPVRGACDLLVVGAGPAGLAAAVNGAADGLRTAVTDAIATGGQAGRSPRIENYLGFPSGVSGAELADRAAIQAVRFGASIVVPLVAAGLTSHDGYYRLRFTDDSATLAKTIIIATGVQYSRLTVPRIEDFEGNGVYFAATEQEAVSCEHEPVAVVGAGNSAGQAAVFLADRASKVYLIFRGEDLGATMSRYLIDRIRRHPAVEVLPQTEVCAVEGGRAPESLVVLDNHSGVLRELTARAVFLFIGARPETAWLNGAVALDRHGYVLTGTDVTGRLRRDSWGHVGRRTFPLETTSPGVFAVGDVRSGSTKRLASAVGEGAMAVHLVHQHLELGGGP